MNHRSSSHLWVSILLIFSGIWLARSTISYPGKCPEVKLMDTFDLEAYMGTWYGYAKLPYVLDISQMCKYDVFGFINSSTVSMVNVFILPFFFKPEHTTSNAKVLGPGQLVVGRDAIDSDYQVLGTDYKSYSVVYHCYEAPSLHHVKVVWIFTRERGPSAATILAATKVLEDSGLPRSFLFPIIPSACSLLRDSTILAVEGDLKLENPVTTV